MRALILTPQGRDASVAAGILHEGGLAAEVCNDLEMLTAKIAQGAGLAVLTDDVIRDADIRSLVAWVIAASLVGFPLHCVDQTGRRIGTKSCRIPGNGGSR
jgi:hypothetical protein